MVSAWYNHFAFIIKYTSGYSVNVTVGDFFYETLKVSEKKLSYVFTSCPDNKYDQAKKKY